MKNDLYVVMYHYVRNLAGSRYPDIKGLDYSLFKQQIEFLKKEFNIVSMEEVTAAYNEGYKLPEKAMLLTFDDGYADHFDFVYPALNEHKCSGAFFVSGKTFCENKLLDVNKVHFILASTSINNLVEDLKQRLDYYRGQEYQIMSNDELYEKYAIANRFDSKEVIFFKRVLQTAIPESLRNAISSYLFEKYVGVQESIFAKELYMNYDQIKCLQRNGMFIGVHGYDHYWLNQLEEKAMRSDIDKALECMQDFIAPNNWVINYPYGSYGENVISYISGKGCSLGLSTDVGVARIDSEKRFVVPRFDTNDFPPKSKSYLSYML